MMYSADRLSLPRGHFSLVVRQHGLVVMRFEAPNLVVNGAATALAKQLAGLTTIDRIGIGDDGSAPTVGDTTLTGDYTRQITDIDASTNEVRFNWVIPANEGPSTPMAVREFGLLAADGTLVARRILNNPVTKSDANGIELSGQWRLSWSIL